MALGVVLLDVRELGRAAKGLVVPVQVAHPLVEVGVAAADVADVALEVLHVDGVEADDGRVEAHILLCQAVAEVEGSGRF